MFKVRIDLFPSGILTKIFYAFSYSLLVFVNYFEGMVVCMFEVFSWSCTDVGLTGIQVG